MADTDNQQGKRFPLFPKLIATSFGFGFLPVAPGTWGAVFAVLIWLPLYMLASPGAILAGTAAGALFFAVAGTWASSVAERYWGKDPVIACLYYYILRKETGSEISSR